MRRFGMLLRVYALGLAIAAALAGPPGPNAASRDAVDLSSTGAHVGAGSPGPSAASRDAVDLSGAGRHVIEGSPRSRAASRCAVDPAIEGDHIVAALDDDRRHEFLRSRIDHGAKRSRAWALGWGLGLTALTAGQLAIAPLVDRADRIDFWVGAGASGIGALSRAVFIPTVIGDARRMRRSRAHGCEAIAQGERALVRGAKWEKNGRALWMHGLSLGYNAVVGLVLGLAFDRPVAGNRLAALGAVVGEIMIITQPTPMLRTLEHYRRGELDRARVRMRPLVLRGGGGVMVGAAM